MHAKTLPVNGTVRAAARRSKPDTLYRHTVPGRAVAMKYAAATPVSQHPANLATPDRQSCSSGTDRYLTALPVRPMKTSVPVTAFR